MGATDPLDGFLLSLGHELRTPINAIVGWTHLLAQQPLSADVAKGVVAIERNARHQARLVDDLIDLNRILSGRLTLECQPVLLEPLVAQAVEAARPTAQRKRVTLAAQLADPPHPVLADPPQLAKVFAHLFANAIRFTPPGGAVTVRTHRDGRSVRIVVADTGEGIASDQLRNVFDRFRQAPTAVCGATGSRGGLGIGLSLARHLIERHGGAIALQSDGPGCGTSVTLRLPVDPALATPGACDPAREGKAATQAVARPLAGLRILLVEDDPDSREVLAEILRLAGARCDAAASGREALACAVRHGTAPAGPTRGRTARAIGTPSVGFDCLVLDLGLPDTDGCRLLQKLRLALGGRDGQLPPAIALTAFGRPADRQRAFSAGFDAFAQKPLDPAGMIGSIGELALQRSSAA